jgi:ribosomal-protein-alanine N-acetyltransferase
MNSIFANRFSWQKPDHNFQDWNALIELENHCFPNNPWTEHQIKSHIDIHHAILANLDDEIPCYVFFMMTADEIEILRLGTHKKFHRMGFASKLILILLEQFPHRNLYLEVEFNNETAKSLYHKLGFQKIGERKNYYGEGRHAYVMKKEVISPES